MQKQLLHNQKPQTRSGIRIHIFYYPSYSDKLRYQAAFVNIPIGLESRNIGLVDLLTERAIYFDEPQGLTLRVEDIPKDMVVETKDRRAEMIGKSIDEDTLLKISRQLGSLFFSRMFGECRRGNR